MIDVYMYFLHHLYIHNLCISRVEKLGDNREKQLASCPDETTRFVIIFLFEWEKM